jgi:cytoskeletal protein RodZ
MLIESCPYGQEHVLKLLRRLYYKENNVERRKGGVELDSTHQNEIKHLGDLLQQRRKETNLSLKEIENATSIRSIYLQALEEGKINQLISPVYAQGFFRQYASFLGIDGEKIIRDHPGLFHRPEEHDFAYGIGTLEVRGHPGAGVKWFPNAVWILVFILMLVFAWYLAHWLGVLG